VTIPSGGGCGYWYAISAVLSDGTNVMLHAMIQPTKPVAATAQVNGSRLEYTAISGTENHVAFSLTGSTYVLRDTGSTIAPGAGCVTVNDNEVNCAASGVVSARIQTRDMADSVVNSTSLLTTMDGGAGPDSLTGGPGRDVLNGGGNDDLLKGGGGDDSFNGGHGNDTLDGGSGKDGMVGGTGNDTTTYLSRTTAVTVTLDGQANDGAAGERDNVQTENVKGGSGNDSLSGDSGPNRLSGTNGADDLSGSSGDDIMAGGPGADTLNGGPGNDTIFGGAGADILRGLDENDTLFARDGAADIEIDCDGGLNSGTADSAQIDTVDPAPLGCESISSG
jgi:Ca2+-binding RTX toxin-like protein